MIIATFNVNSIRQRLVPVAEWLAANRPDVLCVQETKVEDAVFPAEALRATGYHIVFKGMKAYNGVALFSRSEPRNVRFGLDDGGPADEARLLTTEVDGVQILNTYVPQGREIDHPMYQYKQDWYRRLRAYFDRHFSKSGKVLWVGDMNVAPTPIDVHNPEEQANHVCFHEAVRQVYRETLAWGFEDVFRRLHPEVKAFSFFDYRKSNALAGNKGWRIDHILATPSAAVACTRAWIDLEPRKREKASDHAVVAAEFTF